MPCTTDQPAGSIDPTTPKLLYPGSKDVEFCNDDFYYDLNMDDVDLTFENYKYQSGCNFLLTFSRLFKSHSLTAIISKHQGQSHADYM
ncbi:unnamed protein product [Musa acuminata subsp. malaccensis]|uniref:(wild Malaysian banana) hypothetical protein n=1 Tax=Musa acuminata subsp. malaccensis TaxID=214687 RepID=A0A804KL13_MUSAM|nr:unnamed protein product [Musa acuminata subsp. malaccensis]